MTVEHIVIWDLAATDEQGRSAAAARIDELLTGLVGTVESIRDLVVGVNGAYPEKNGDVAVVAHFDDYEGLEAYIVHPAHQEAAAEIRTLVTGRTAIDFVR